VLTADNIRSVFGVEPTFVATPKDYRYLIFD
jgi:hypothetical protein